MSASELLGCVAGEAGSGELPLRRQPAAGLRLHGLDLPDYIPLTQRQHGRRANTTTFRWRRRTCRSLTDRHVAATSSQPRRQHTTSTTPPRRPTLRRSSCAAQRGHAVLQCCLSVGPPHCSRWSLRRSSCAAQRGDAVLQCCLSVGPPHCSRWTLRRSSCAAQRGRMSCNVACLLVHHIAVAGL